MISDLYKIVAFHNFFLFFVLIIFNLILSCLERSFYLVIFIIYYLLLRKIDLLHLLDLLVIIDLTIVDINQLSIILHISTLLIFLLVKVYTFNPLAIEETDKFARVVF